MTLDRSQSATLRQNVNRRDPTWKRFYIHRVRPKDWRFDRLNGKGRNVARWVRIIFDYTAGYTMRECAEHEGTTVEDVRRILQKAYKLMYENDWANFVAVPPYDCIECKKPLELRQLVIEFSTTHIPFWRCPNCGKWAPMPLVEL